MNVSLGTGARKELGWALVAVVSLVWLGWALENLTGTLLVGSLIYIGLFIVTEKFFTVVAPSLIRYL
jgi:hypothetical protein